MDTAGQDDYQTMLDSWIASADGFILVYSIDDKESFDVLKAKYDRIIKNKIGEKPSIIMVGNKCDLIDKRKISQEEAEKKAKSLNINFLEVSALEKINVKETFLVVAKELLVKKAKIDTSSKQDVDPKKRCYCF